MPIALDAMGGDSAPQSAVEGAFRAATEDGCAILLVGDRARIEPELRKLGGSGRIEIVHAEMVIGTVAGVDRPALAAVLPNATGKTVLLDVGANVDSKAVHLREFAVMGHFYAQEVIGTLSPRVGLMSIGEEEGKGTDLTR